MMIRGDWRDLALLRHSSYDVCSHVHQASPPCSLSLKNNVTFALDRSKDPRKRSDTRDALPKCRILNCPGGLPDSASGTSPHRKWRSFAQFSAIPPNAESGKVARARECDKRRVTEDGVNHAEFRRSPSSAR